MLSSFQFFVISLLCTQKHECIEILYHLYRFGVGDYDWAEFTPRLKQKTYEEIREYVEISTLILYILQFSIIGCWHPDKRNGLPLMC